MTTATKVYETKDAIADGADEIDMVINVGALKDGDFDYVKDEIALVRAACPGKVLKVIIETCLLTEREKAVMCVLADRAGADLVKTSTGFSKGGATHEDVIKLREYIDAINEAGRLRGRGELGLKASGGIKDLEDAALYIKEGADRLGTSRVVKAAKALEDQA
jgi:deoxyribose-phosphate aldolase